jgi:HD-like signal output (HDOD) protein
MKFEQPGKDKLANEALLAGLMVDAGKLVLASEFVDEYTSIYGGHIPEGIPNWRREIARFGASHSDVGAYVLGIWGFSDPIVEAVAYHHEPSRCIHRGFSPLTTVHAASAMVEAAAEGNDLLAALDEGYLESLGVANRLDEWRKIAQKIINAGAAA